MRDALIVLGTTLTDTSHAFGTKGDVDPIQRLVSAATTWGGNPRKDAIYLNFTPPSNDGDTASVPFASTISEERPQRIFAQQHHLEEERRRFSHHCVRRLRWQNSQLLTYHGRVDLYGAALSSAGGDFERRMEIPGGGGGQLIAETLERVSRRMPCPEIFILTRLAVIK